MKNAIQRIEACTTLKELQALRIGELGHFTQAEFARLREIYSDKWRALMYAAIMG